MTACGVCGKAVGDPPPVTVAGIPVCARCHGRQVTIRTGATMRLGARTFYVSSLSRGGVEHTVKAFRRRRTCTCEDYTHRAQVLRQPCKHCRLVRLLAKAAGGVARIPLGATLRFRLDSPETVRRRRGAATRG